MSNNVLIISQAETFSVRGIELKLQGIGITPTYCVTKVSELGDKIKKADLIVLYTDEDIVKHSEVLVFVKDHCLEEDIKVMVIGSKLEYETVTKVIPEEYIERFFDRPLVMDKFLSAVETFLAGDREKRKSILIVDDNVTYMSMIMDWLKDTYRVFMVNSGVTAITWLANNHADLILLDYEMPVTTGPMVLEMFRSQPEYRDIPVMFLTGVSDKESIMKVLALKPNDYLLKTIDKYGLRKKLEDFFNSVE